MKQTWRWFGPRDRVSIDDVLQAGVEGVVSALHHVPTGTVWTPEEIAQRQREIGTMVDGAPTCPRKKDLPSTEKRLVHVTRRPSYTGSKRRGPQHGRPRPPRVPEKKDLGVNHRVPGP